MSPVIGQRVVAPPPERALPPAGGPTQANGQFQGHLDAAGPQGSAPNVAPVAQTQPSPGGDAAGPSASTQKVNRGTVLDQQDLFGRFEQVRREFDTYLKKSTDLEKLVAEGKLKPQDPKVVQHRREEMRLLLHFQSEMQGAALKVEIASKVVEHGTSGAKTVLSTQA